jgi:hypothetical protein
LLLLLLQTSQRRSGQSERTAGQREHLHNFKIIIRKKIKSQLHHHKKVRHFLSNINIRLFCDVYYKAICVVAGQRIAI